MRGRLSTLLYLFYLFEVGLFLFFVPWSSFWESNYFVDRIPQVRDLCLNSFARGAISSLGVLHLLVGTVDSLAFIRSERR
jgi:hypothetical protein